MRVWVFILLIFVLILTGCFGSYVKPTETPPVLKNWTADEILDVVSQRAQAIQQVRTLITVQIEGKRPGFFMPSQGLQATLWAERPHPPAARLPDGQGQASQIRLQGFNPVGGILFDLVSENGRLKFSAPGQSKEVQTSLEERLIRGGEKSSFSLELLDALAGGGQPLMRPSEFSAVEQNGREIILYQFKIGTGGKAQLVRTYWLDLNRLLAKQAVYFDPSGHPSVTVLYHGYQPIPSSGGTPTFPGEAIVSPEGAPVSPGGARGEGFWPREITATLNKRSRLVITFQEVKLNQPFQAGAFSFGMSPQ